MKKLSVIALTKKGFELGDKLSQLAPGQLDRFTINKFFKTGWNNEEKKLSNLIAKIFYEYEGIILIMATGIAVRVIAPFVVNKAKDPAVVVMDEKNQYAISLLSGHLGGANSLAQELSSLTGCQAIITTATDLNNITSVDALARQWQLAIEPVEHIKHFNSALLNGENLDFWLDEGIIISQENLVAKNIDKFADDSPGNHVLITWKVKDKIIQNQIVIRPQNLVLGIGCQKEYPKEKILKVIQDFFIKNALSIKSIAALATIEIKKNEEAILYLAEKLQVPIHFYQKEELEDCLQKNPGYNYSSFVKQIVDVGGVCEPAAALAAQNDELLIKKTNLGGITLAVTNYKKYKITVKQNNWFKEVLK